MKLIRLFFSPIFIEEWLLVGTKQGHLLLYRIKKDIGKLILRMAQKVHYIIFISCTFKRLLTQVRLIDGFFLHRNEYLCWFLLKKKILHFYQMWKKGGK